MNPEDKCFICENISEVHGNYHLKEVTCPRCGVYRITPLGRDIAEKNKTKRQVANISYFLRENRKYQIDAEEVERLLQVPTQPLHVRAQRFFSFLAQAVPNPGDMLDLIVDLGPADVSSHSFLQLQAYLGISGSVDQRELNYIVSRVLAAELGWLEDLNGRDFQISPAGWASLMSEPNRIGHLCFVAVRFKPEYNALFDAVESATLEAGYMAKRVDRHEHINRIDDEIISLLRKARFCIADLTEQNQGVYFEAGFALGISIPVIWTCRKDDLASVHFDNRQYNTLTWDPKELNQFEERLRFRIEAVLGRGNYVQGQPTRM
jgi:hypothetical protein